MITVPAFGWIGGKLDFIKCMENSGAVLMEGALGERLKREYEFVIDGPAAMAGLVRSAAGREALQALWREYLAVAAGYGLPFLAMTPTRRANRERIKAAGFDESVIKENVEALREIKANAGTEMYIGGLMGCRGDAYTGEGALGTQEARSFHAWQADLFKEAGADFLYAGIMPVLAEAEGMAMAMSDTGLPYIISFTIRQDGRLIDGTAIDTAIIEIDSCTENNPVCYMTNCVHPDIVYKALSHDFNRTEAVRRRFWGIQANTSPLPYEELDGCSDLKSSAPEALADSMMRLRDDFGFRIFGGCCGTNASHMRAAAKALWPDW